jgi:hypothetical protein
MNLYTKTKIILRQTEWIILYKKKNNPQGRIEEFIDKSIYQSILDPARLVKKSAGEIFNGASFWFFIFFVISFIGIIILAKLYQYFPDTRQIGTFNLYIPFIIYILSIFFTYFMFTFRMPSATKQSFVNEDNVEQVIININDYITSEKEADLIDKNISDLAELLKRRKIIIRIITMLIIAYIFNEPINDLTSINTGITIVVATLFEMYALGSKAIFTNAKLAVREIALELNKTSISNKYEETNNLP